MINAISSCGVVVLVSVGFWRPSSPSMPAFAVDNMASSGRVDLTSVRAKIGARTTRPRSPNCAISPRTTSRPTSTICSASRLRKTGDFKTSLTYYTKALDLQPDHKAAREYLGELYVETGNMAKAKEQLAALAKLCPAAARNARTWKRRSPQAGVQLTNIERRARPRLPFILQGRTP